MALTVSNRQIRTAVNTQAAEVDAHRTLLRQVVNNELVTRRRVDVLEQFRDLGLMDRLRWLMRGYRG